MTPRLKTSKKWTSFPEEYQTQIEDVFKQEFQQQIGSSTLIVEGRIYPEEILLRVGLSKKGQLRQDNFEVSVNYTTGGQDAVDKIGACIDAAASMMADFFEVEEIDFPKTWEEYDFEGIKVLLQYSTENTQLEKEANEWLGQNEKALVHEEDDEEEDLDEEALKEPSMFKGKKKKEDLH